MRERVYLYASLKIEKDICEEEGFNCAELPTGRIVGSMEIFDCTEEGWRDYEWHLRNPERLLKFLKPKNQPQPGIWRPQF